VVFIPSVSGGLGHVGRTLRLARELERQRPGIRIQYVLHQDRLRLTNLEFVKSTGYSVQVLPVANRDTRDHVVRALLGHADLVVDDTYRHLIPYRRLIDAVWVSIPMYPLADELFMDWPLLEQVDRVLWTYPETMGLPDELRPLGRKVTVTGAILGGNGRPCREKARRALGLAEDERVITYAPRGMPFGRDFGERLLAGLVGGFIALRARHPRLRLVLTGVRDPTELRFPGMPDVRRVRGLEVCGVLPPDRVQALTAAADAVVAEGTTTTFETIAADTPLLMVPGTIYETWLIGTRLYEADAAVILWTERVTPDSMAEHLARILDEPGRARQRAARARRFLGPDGTEKAACALLKLLDGRR
jgi:glycosyltransferase involved in cell wall biosynthesis